MCNTCGNCIYSSAALYFCPCFLLEYVVKSIIVWRDLLFFLLKIWLVYYIWGAEFHLLCSWTFALYFSERNKKKKDLCLISGNQLVCNIVLEYLDFSYCNEGKMMSHPLTWFSNSEPLRLRSASITHWDKVITLSHLSDALVFLFF